MDLYYYVSDEAIRFVDEFVAAPVAAVKSRVVVSTSNANRVKTPLHSSNATNKFKSQSSMQVIALLQLFGNLIDSSDSSVSTICFVA